ncbi:hypothetical protein QTN25_008028 [Entamoeba marina]
MQDTLAIYHQQLPETTIKYQTAKSREPSGQLAYPSISTIYQGKDEVDVVEFLKNRCEPRTKNGKQCTKSKLQRDFARTKRIVLNNYLIDLAILSGVHITIKKN